MYHRHFGTNYVSALQRAKDPSDLVLFPDSFYSAFAISALEKQTVALVGNAKVRDAGMMIDDCDAVIRLNYPYNWKRCRLDDGERLDFWLGLGRNEVWNPTTFHNPHDDFEPVDLTSYLESARSLHCISHLHIDASFWEQIQKRGLLDKFYAHWAAPVVFEEIEKTDFGLDQRFLSLITQRAYLETGYGGWPVWEILFTGIRSLLLIAISRPKEIKIFGMNLFTDGERTPWDMHIHQYNLEAYQRIIWLAREAGITITVN